MVARRVAERIADRAKSAVQEGRKKETVVRMVMPARSGSVHSTRQTRTPLLAQAAQGLGQPGRGNVLLRDRGVPVFLRRRAGLQT
jgi:hypothetical protein